MPYTYEYPRPAVTVDCVIFSQTGDALQVMLIRRGQPPFAGLWALPGGFVEMDESLDEAARRELKEETGLENIPLEQLHTFGAVNRDPRHRTVSVAYLAQVRQEDVKPEAGDDASEVGWFNVEDLPQLAFDHGEIIQVALERLHKGDPKT